MPIDFVEHEAEPCPDCEGELHLWADRYEYGDEWLVCEDCDFEEELIPLAD